MSDVVCTSGPHDPSYVEQHGAYSIALVTDGNFQYRTVQGAALMTPGSLLLGNEGAGFQCGHQHGRGLRIFEQIVGVTPGQYMPRMRLHRAAVRLRTADEPIAAVALECGFEDPATFNRQFRRATGQTPRAYRAQSIVAR